MGSNSKYEIDTLKAILRIARALEEISKNLSKNLMPSISGAINTVQYTQKSLAEAADKKVLVDGWRPVDEYDYHKHLYVLIKRHYKGQELPPTVALRDCTDGKWYDTYSNVVDFEVTGFFDVQQLNNKEK